MTRKEWLALRRQSVGASEAAALFNLHPYQSPYSLWAEKTGEVEPPDESTDQQEFGLVIEPYLAKRYERETGRRILELKPLTVFTHDSIPASATPDRIFATGIHVANNGVLELKRWSHYSPHEDIPAHAQIQVQQQMLCTELRIGAFAILGPFDKFYTAEATRNEQFLALLVEKIEEFWFYVTKGTPPPADGHAATTEALKRLHPKDNGSTVVLPAEAEKWTSELAWIEKQKKELDTRETACKNSLRAAIGDATYGRLPDGSGWTLRTTPREGYTVEATEYRALRRSKKLLTA